MKKRTQNERDGKETEEEEEEIQMKGGPMRTYQMADGTFKLQHEDSESELADEDEDETTPWPIAYEGFFAMMHVFEASAIRSMAPEKAKEGIFPTEVYEIILEYVDDVTYQACTCVSRKFRRCCLASLRLMEHTVIHGLHPNAEIPQSWDTSSFVLSHRVQGEPSPYQLVRRYDRHPAEHDSTVWLVVCGIPQRLTLLLKFLFLDYEVPSIWAEIDNHDPLVEVEREEQHRRKILGEMDDNSPHYWKKYQVLDAMEMQSTAELDVTQLYEVWTGIVASYGLSKGYDDNRFDLPAHSKEVVIKTKWLGICVGYIWIKRPDAFVGPAEVWDVALEEAGAKVSISIK